MCQIVRGVKESTVLGAKALPIAALHGELRIVNLCCISLGLLQQLRGVCECTGKLDLFVFSYLGRFFRISFIWQG